MKNLLVLFNLIVSMLFLNFLSPAQNCDMLSMIDSTNSKGKPNNSITESDYSLLTHYDWGQDQSQRIKKVTQEERLLQIFLEVKYLETILEKDKNGDFIPLTINSNNLFDTTMELEFRNKKVRILNQTSNHFESIMNISKYKIKKKKACLEFIYKDEKVKIQLKKVGFNWEYSKLKASNNSGKNINIIF